MKRKAPSVALIGTGRMAYHLGHALLRAGVELKGLCGRDQGKVDALAAELGCMPYLLPRVPGADLLLLAVSDDAVRTVARQLPKGGHVVAHCSGAQGHAILGRAPHRGVLWPIKSLSPGKPADLSRVPLVVDANDEQARTVLLDVARSISGKVVEMPLEKRRTVHLAAVLASNFPVFLLREAGRLLEQEGLSPELLTPLWKAMSAKVAEVGPEQALTGPARRGDLDTIKRHLERLEEEGDLRRAYALLSELILKAYHPRKRGITDL
ncbi:MAG: DUF2520 domain-containing protein [Flavobacteriales bacterium]|nr:DUF2520 domain-containing protein [Flavobacteriales bacterium]